MHGIRAETHKLRQRFLSQEEALAALFSQLRCRAPHLGQDYTLVQQLCKQGHKVVWPGHLAAICRSQARTFELTRAS